MIWSEFINYLFPSMMKREENSGEKIPVRISDWI
jgi:hypothetical protein